MKWTADEKGYQLETKGYTARVEQQWQLFMRLGGPASDIGSRPDGWKWQISKDGKRWKKGSSRLLKDCKRRVEDVITSDQPEGLGDANF